MSTYIKQKLKYDSYATYEMRDMSIRESGDMQYSTCGTVQLYKRAPEYRVQ